MMNPRFVPGSDHRVFAGLIEVDEFVKEFKESYKWWSSKQNNWENIVDEYIDTLHFIAGLAIDLEMENSYYDFIHDSYKREVKNHTGNNPFDLFDALLELRASTELDTAVGRATYILEQYGYGEGHLREAYDRKNAENFRRIAEGY